MVRAQAKTDILVLLVSTLLLINQASTKCYSVVEKLISIVGIASIGYNHEMIRLEE